MGQYLIPNAKSTIEAAAFLGEAAVPDRTWEATATGVLFKDPALTNAQCATLYNGFTPSGQTDETVRWPLPARWQTHIAHLRDYRVAQRNGTQAAKTQAVRLAEAEHVIADLIEAIAYLRSELVE